MFQKGFLVFLTTFICIPFIWSQKTQPVSPAPPRYSQQADVVEELREGWNLSLAMNMGASQLFPGIDFRRTPMADFYEAIKAGPLPDYQWDDFLEDYDFKKSIVQPRFGFSALLSYGNIPAFVLGEAMSSTSSYQKMSFAATIGLGKDIVFGDDAFLTFKGGYKIVFQDSGFGSATLVNSVGNKTARERMQRFFESQINIGKPRGDLMTMRLGMGKYIGRDRMTNIGVELYGELDLTRQTLRIARMNALGLNAFIHFALF